MQSVTIAGLIDIALRNGGPRVRLCDGGLVRWGADLFRSSHPIFGAIGGLDASREEVGESVPDLSVTFLAATGAGAAEFTRPDYQGSPFNVWLAEVDVESGAVSGTPTLMFGGLLDAIEIQSTGGRREVKITAVSLAERLFQINDGNTLSGMFHKRIYAGETGEDNATALGTTVAWGAASPVGAAASGSVSGGVGADPRAGGTVLNYV